MTWAPSAHAVNYTATVTGAHGHVVTCSSESTTCSVKLNCGYRYTATVIASSSSCDSLTGATATFDSAPCLPDRVEAELYCNNNSFAVQWRGSVGGETSYTAIAIGRDDTNTTCNTTNTHCTIQNLKCGLNYGIVVTTPSVSCGQLYSDYMIQSAPCEPNSVMVNLQCSTNVALVTWGNSGPDQTQVVSAVDSRGVTTTCNSSSSNCTFDQLLCGESYTVNVVSHTNSCSSEPAFAQGFETAPCMPTHVTAHVDCDTGITMVTWDESRGAASYTVYAWGNHGHNDECNATDTFCDFPHLACGQDYTITVVARHDTCVSLVSESIYASTGPCPHSGLETILDCDANTVAVSWTHGSGIRYYNTSADAFDITHEETCSTNSTSCNISSLHCGESYKISVSGQGWNCSSPAQDWHRIVAAPCPPTHLRVDSSCESNDISVSWQASQGSVTYVAVAENAQGQRWMCNTSSTSCSISGLLCGQQYQVYVAGADEKCIGAKSNIEEFQTAPCVPQNIQNDLDCLSGVLNITWQSTGYAPYFHASVVSIEGDVRMCKTDTHDCIVQGMRCGLTYNVTVVAQDGTCNSSHSPAEQVTTAPCALSSFLHTVDCETGIVFVNWTNSIAGVMYAVSAVDASGREHNCSAANSGCGLNTLDCGKEYNITVTPSRDGCVGTDSPTMWIQTVPCTPHLSDVEIDCLTNSAWVIGHEAAGAEDYIVLVTDSLGDVQMFPCNSTSDSTCVLPLLMCSQNFTFSLKARGQQCTSQPSNVVTTHTAPCPPVVLEKSVSCDNGTISISWATVPGAVSYTATLEQMNKHTACCTTSDTSCDITGLPCGEMYVLLVMAEGQTCNSSQSQGDVVRTVPCVPQNLQSSLSCIDNMASMSWNHTNGGQMYRVRATSMTGEMDECSTHETKCDLTGLSCGQLYAASVTAENSDCQSEPSESVTIKTVPCTPENISSTVDCDTNSLNVHWSESSGADSYIATVLDSNGQTTTCQGTNGSCGIMGIGCGLIYHVSVVSSDGYCSSPPTKLIDTVPVPCPPTHITAELDCYTQTATVGWYPSDGAVSYTVKATNPGDLTTCETNTTNCDLERLLCGQSYSIAVIAVGSTCSTVAYMTGMLLTEPCIPSYISVYYSLSIGQVLWSSTVGADNYAVEGVTEQGLMVSCNTNNTYCVLYNVECGQIYNISVTANNVACQGVSTSTEEVQIKTEPCPPTNVQASVNCSSNMGSLSWEASFGAVAYEAHLAGRDGHSLSCYTEYTFCSIEGLHCGNVYYTTVTAIGETLNSTQSTTMHLDSAPCAVTNVATSLVCHNNTVEVNWSFADGADSYMVTAVSSDGHQAVCESHEQQCDLTDLLCGQKYNISITSISDHCQAETVSEVTFTTRPCEPLYVGVDLQCGTSTANVYWEKSKEVGLYMAVATSSMGMSHQCNSTNSSCKFSDLDCGETYRFYVTAFSDMCYSENSSVAYIQTEPCQPTELRADGSCDNDTVAVYWSGGKGATGYVVTATGHLGYVTSFQTDEAMIETELPCGQLFTFIVKAQDDQCDSAVSQPAIFKTGPCVPQHVQSHTHCEDKIGSVSWADTDGAEYYLAIAVGEDGHTHMCTTVNTSCTWDDLHCGERYTVHIIADDDMCSSMPSNSTTIQMASCIPQNLTSTVNCTTKVASLTWNPVETADYYIVSAGANSSHAVQLSTNDTWTFFHEFLCGQVYFLTVQAVDSMCTSRPSEPSVLKSEPCPPTTVLSTLNCESEIGMISWTGSSGAEFYIATITQQDGQSQSCWSESLQCGMPYIPCGQNFTVTVVASNENCNSEPSEESTLQSGPCVPRDVDVALDCTSNEAVVTWNASKGALSYTVIAQSTLGTQSICESVEPTCTLTNLTCGQSYFVQVVAQDDLCTSLPSSPAQLKSVPCTPNIDSVVFDCFTNSALLDWAFAEGALNYSATAQSSSGHVSICNSSYTNCELLNLQCGQTYTVVTIASDEECSSPTSNSLLVESAPCPPDGVVTLLDCPTNTAQVEWQASMGADTYEVQAVGMGEYESLCETGTQSCVLSDLMCGLTYNISVTAINSVCNVSQSNITQLRAAPCVPQHVEARVVCESGAVALSWEPSKGALSYTSVAHGSSAYASVCNSSVTACLFDDLMCGFNYSITVSATDEKCTSAGSSVVELNTVPCVPQMVSAEMVCKDSTGVVSWEDGEGVSSYMVQAFGPNGHRIECNNMAPSCQLPSMYCGQLYNLTVTAQDGRCNNSHAYLNLQSVPCRPTNVKASAQCRSNSAAVTWEHAGGAISYLAVGVTSDGSHQTECNNTMTYCDMSDLLCGQTYNVSVFGQDESCSSVESNTTFLQTAPCPPQDVAVDALCDEGAIYVSWSANPDAQSFHVVAVSQSGARLYCNSSGTVCTIDNLPCGESYSVTVASVRNGCESEPSPVVETSSAPCVPTNINTYLDCVTNSAWMMWDPSEGAVSYFVLAQGVGGHNATCTSTSPPCNVPDLKCGMHYTFHVTAVNKHCHSNQSTPFELETGPCALTSISTATQCNSDTILVEWAMSNETPFYVATAEGYDKSLTSCNSTSSSCELQGIHCDMHYSIIVSASSDRCSSLRSPPAMITTAPCAPQNVTAVPACEENGAIVTWAHSPVATSYLLTAAGRDGHVASCNSTVNNCTLADLHCGQPYSLSITARGDNCTSEPTTASFRTVPCAPSGLAVSFECENTAAILTWTSSEGAAKYYGCAKSMNGEILYCDSTITSCTIEGLQCGDMYNFSVEATDSFCNSSYSAPVERGAAPCAPTALDVGMQRIDHNQWLMSSWETVDCPNVEYLVEISGQIQDNPQALMSVSSYWLSIPYFETLMPCSTPYNLTISSRNSAGASEPSSAYMGVTAPCAPKNVQYTDSTESATLSWDASVLATGYTVYDVSGEGRVVLCSTTGLSCQLTNFSPGYIEVTASNAVGESIPSGNITGPVGSRRKRDLRASLIHATFDNE
ncbi:uncharacterized protein LOC129188936 [Dunckerocampus dactyliophorus]|uniref:uncharacterized protein LOC129188936 n=1 Tax=Dunckerocampus dactyliophorus TaxID=161453 RepID=UPI0024053769|nr:uncharacterized protein LOC129188936 [Dunckerocampus dactyliophorus]